MLPIIENFISMHKDTKPIVVADAAMLDEERLIELQQKKISYIVGARLSNASLSLIKQIHDTLQGKHGSFARFSSRHGHLVCDFSRKRYKKELIELNKLIQKAEDLVAKQSSGSKAKFIKKPLKKPLSLTMHSLKKKATIGHKRLLY